MTNMNVVYITYELGKTFHDSESRQYKFHIFFSIKTIKVQDWSKTKKNVLYIIQYSVQIYFF